jgi:hypothetical protein
LVVAVVGIVASGFTSASGQVPPQPDADGDGYADQYDCAPTDPTRGSLVDIPLNGIDENCSGTDAFPFVSPQVAASFTWKGNETRVRKVVVSNVSTGTNVAVVCNGPTCPRKINQLNVPPGLRTHRIVFHRPLGARPLRAPHERLAILVSPPIGLSGPPKTLRAVTTYTPRRNRAPRRVDGCEQIDGRFHKRGCGILRVVGQFKAGDGVFTVRRLYVADLPAQSRVEVVCFGRNCPRHFFEVKRRPRVSSVYLTKKSKGTQLRHGSSLFVIVSPMGRLDVRLITGWTVTKSGRLHRTDGCKNGIVRLPGRLVPCPD